MLAHSCLKFDILGIDAINFLCYSNYRIYGIFSKGVYMKDLNLNLNLYGVIALIIVLVGGINWGLIGLFNVNIISGILGIMLGRLIFIIVGVAAGYLAYLIYLEKTKKSSV